MYKLIFEKIALRNLNKLDNVIKNRIWDKLQECKEDPFRFVEHLEYINGSKLRVGDYRVILNINKTAGIITILKVDHRSKIYHN